MLLRNEQNLLIDRDLAWLEFNRRVLKEAKDPTVPLLERVKFLAIFSSNLDEFFMVRVAGLKRWLYNKQQSPDPEDADVASALSAISQRVHELTEEQHLCFLDTVLPQLTAEGIHLVRPEEMTSAQEQCLEDFFHKTLYPIVTPLAIDPGHPFPYLTNRSLSLVVSLRSKASSPLPYTELSIVNIPAQVVPRFIQLPTQGRTVRVHVARTCACAIICRASIMVSTSSRRTPFVLRVTPNSALCGGGMKIC